MDPQLLTLILLIIGIALIFAEFMVPSGGLIAVACVACFLGSVFTAYKSWGVSHPAVFWSYVASLFVIIPGSVYGAIQVLLNTSLGNHVFLPVPKSEDVTPHQQEVARLQTYVGKQGKSLSLMTPGGMVMVEGARLHAMADGIMIEPNADVEVVRIQGTVVVVRAAGPAEPPSHTPDETQDTLSPSRNELNVSETDDFNPFG